MQKDNSPEPKIPYHGETLMNSTMQPENESILMQK